MNVYWRFEVVLMLFAENRSIEARYGKRTRARAAGLVVVTGLEIPAPTHARCGAPSTKSKAFAVSRSTAAHRAL